jgi:hypothetical protein
MHLKNQVKRAVDANNPDVMPQSHPARRPKKIAKRLGMMLLLILGVVNVSRAGECDQMALQTYAADYRGQHTIVLLFHRPSNCNDAFNVMVEVPPGGWNQVELDSNGDGSCIALSGTCIYYARNDKINGNPDKPYIFKIQSCRTRTLAPSVCSPWSSLAYYLPYGPDTCQDGYVWREASASDHVCVAPSSRDEARTDNSQAPSRVSATDHSYGPDTCIPSFVWREAFQNDHVCVSPAVRDRTKSENQDAEGHYARNWH